MKEELPSILISDGWETDENDALVEVVIPNAVEMYQAPTKITFKGENLNWIPSTAAALQEIELTNVQTLLTTNQFKTYTQLNTVKLDKVTSITQAGTANNSGQFNALSNLVSFVAPELLVLYDTARPSTNAGQYLGIFNSCGLTHIALPKLQRIQTAGDYYYGKYIGTFNSCTALLSVDFPRIQYLGNNISSATSATVCGTFGNCTALQSVNLGSAGNPVSYISQYTFTGCTQPGLTITIYTNNGASLSGSPWGATNATIVYETA